MIGGDLGCDKFRELLATYVVLIDASTLYGPFAEAWLSSFGAMQWVSCLLEAVNIWIQESNPLVELEAGADSEIYFQHARCSRAEYLVYHSMCIQGLSVTVEDAEGFLAFLNLGPGALIKQ